MVIKHLHVRKADPASREQKRRQTVSPAHSPLWLCVYLPDLALDVVKGSAEHLDPTSPCAVLDEAVGRPVIHTASPAAAAAGIARGMPLAGAYALCSSLAVRRRDFKAEIERLEQLAAWAQQFTPLVSLEPPQALLLEVRGSLRLFGGLDKLRRRLGDELRALGHRFFIAVAPTPLASLLLASNHQAAVMHKEALRSALGKLPIRGLPLTPELLRRLRHTGVTHLHELWRLPRDGLARRFGAELLHYLDRAMGVLPDPRRPYRLPHRFVAELELSKGLSNNALLLEAAQHLIARLSHFLRKRDAGTSRLRIELRHRQRAASVITLGLRHSTGDGAHLLGLLKVHLDHLKLTAPVLALRLITDEIHPFIAAPQMLFIHQRAVNDATQRDQDWQHVMEQLEARLGRKCIHQLQAHEDHRPEYAWRYGEAALLQNPSTRLNRPLWLLPRPQTLPVHQDRPWRRSQLSLKPEPERIESGWWDARDIRRDYYIAADTDGSRLWIFRDLHAGRWYLHGYFG